MQSKKLIKDICSNALFAAIYVVLCLFIGDLAFGYSIGLSFRIAEILIALCCFSKRYMFGAVIGCLIVNITGGMLPDIIIGTLQSCVAVACLYFIKKKQLGIFLAALSCGLMIGAELYFIFENEIGIWIFVTTFVSEYLLLEIGYFLFYGVLKNSFCKKLILE